MLFVPSLGLPGGSAHPGKARDGLWALAIGGSLPTPNPISKDWMHQNWFWYSTSNIEQASQLNTRPYITFHLKTSASYPIYLKAILRCTCIRLWSRVWWNRSIFQSPLHLYPLLADLQGQAVRGGFSLMLRISSTVVKHVHHVPPASLILTLLAGCVLLYNFQLLFR